MRIAREIIGYLIGLVLFVLLVPAIMWWVAGGTHPTSPRLVAFVVMAIVGIGLSIWSISYMRLVGRGNPMDAFNHEVAPCTSTLMTEGPYRICRNPMLLGVLVYYLGVVILLGSPKAALVLVAYCLIMTVQVRTEEVRLEQDFGEEYQAYCARTRRLIPFVW